MTTAYGNLALSNIGETITANSISDNLKKIYTNHANTSANPPWANGTSTANVANAVAGVLWYDTTNSKINVYNGTTSLWNSIGGMEVGSVAPSSPQNGTLWYDTKNKYIKFYSNEQLPAATLISATGPTDVGTTYYITYLGSTTQAEWNSLAGTTNVTYSIGSTFTRTNVAAITSNGKVVPTIAVGAGVANTSYLIASKGTTTDASFNGMTGKTGEVYYDGQIITTTTATSTPAFAAGSGTAKLIALTSGWAPYGAIVQPSIPSMNAGSSTTEKVGTIWYDTSASKLKVYNGTLWSGVGGGATISDTAPSGPSDGDMWFDSATEYRTFIWSDTAQAWVDASPAVTPSPTVMTRYTQTADGTATVYTFATMTAQVVVMLNGVIQVPLTDYNFDVNAKTVTFVTAPVSGTEVGVLVFSIYSASDALMKSSGGIVSANVTINGTLTATRGISTMVSATSVNGTVTPDFSLGQNFYYSLTGGVTLNGPTNLVVGQTGFFIFKQDATGGKTLSLTSTYKKPGGTAPTLSTTANAIDVIPYIVLDANNILLGAIQSDFK